MYCAGSYNEVSMGVNWTVTQVWDVIHNVNCLNRRFECGRLCQQELFSLCWVGVGVIIIWEDHYWHSGTDYTFSHKKCIVLSIPVAKVVQLRYFYLSYIFHLHSFSKVDMKILRIVQICLLIKGNAMAKPWQNSLKAQFYAWNNFWQTEAKIVTN